MGMKPSAASGPGLSQILLAAGLLSSVLLNAALVYYTLWKGDRADQPGAAIRTALATTADDGLAVSLPIRKSGPGDNLSIDGSCFDAQLLRAEATYKRNQERRSVLTGTLEDQTLPLQGKAMHAFLRVRSAQWKGSYWKEYMLFPRYPCLEEERVGMWGEGGKWVCLQSLHKKGKDIVLYSIGSVGDTTFEEGMFTLLGVHSETFDPFIQDDQKKALAKLAYLTFHNYGLSIDESETVQERARGGISGPAKDIHKIMKELKHEFVDVFKIDCEGCESGFSEFLARTTAREKPIFGQILMEIHDANDLQLESTLMQRLGNLGYRLYHLEPNFFGLGSCWEVAFIHENFCQAGGVVLQKALPSRRLRR